MFFFFKYHNQKWDMWTDALHTSTGDFGFLVHYLQSWLWMVLFFFFFFWESCGWPKQFPEKPYGEVKESNAGTEGWRLSFAGEHKTKKTLPEMLLKALNEPQKHHRAQCSAIRWRKSTVWATVKQQWSYQYRRSPRKIVTRKPLTQTFGFWKENPKSYRLVNTSRRI